MKSENNKQTRQLNKKMLERLIIIHNVIKSAFTRTTSSCNAFIAKRPVTARSEKPPSTATSTRCALISTHHWSSTGKKAATTTPTKIMILRSTKFLPMMFSIFLRQKPCFQALKEAPSTNPFPM
ncbi:MAG: hypothetical protein SPI86_01045 [Treponemataceae bacterium]|nr:hypothetical protein [Spirochaetales bacterium]MDY6030326.1 hypothetical protein [Treponemataceae bacterium]